MLGSGAAVSRAAVDHRFGSWPPDMHLHGPRCVEVGAAFVQEVPLRRAS